MLSINFKTTTTNSPFLCAYFALSWIILPLLLCWILWIMFISGNLPSVNLFWAIINSAFLLNVIIKWICNVFHFLECCRSILWYCEIKAWVCTVSQLQLWTPWVGTALLKSSIVPDFVHYLTVRWCSRRPDRMCYHSSTVHIPISCELWFTVHLSPFTLTEQVQTFIIFASSKKLECLLAGGRVEYALPRTNQDFKIKGCSGSFIWGSFF